MDTSVSPEQVRVVLATEHRLVGQALLAALEHRGWSVTAVEWQDAVTPPPVSSRLAAAEPDVGLFVGQPSWGLPLSEVLWLFDQGRVPWVVLTPDDSGAVAGALLQHGAALVLHEPTSWEVLEPLLLGVATGAAPADPADELARSALLERWQQQPPAVRLLVARLRRLSPRERQVLTLLHQGCDVASIAELIGVRRGTVRSQVKGVLRKLDVRSQREAVLAVERLRRWDADRDTGRDAG